MEGAVYGKVEFVEDASLKDDAIVDFYVEYDDWVLSQTKFCTLKDITGTGIGIFVSDNCLLHPTRRQSDPVSGPKVSRAKGDAG